MSTNDPKQAQQAPSGFFGRLWGKGEVKRKAVKANLGEKNTLFYDEKLKRWRKEGEELSHAEMEPPPPPVLGSGFSGPAGGDSQRQAASRYADAGGFGKGAQNTAGSSILPRPSTAPSVQAPFVPKQTSAAGAPKFFVPGGGAVSSGKQNIAPSWGSFSQAGGAAGQGLSPRPSPASGHSTPVAQSPTPKSRPSPQSEPPLLRGRSPQQSEDDQLSWQQWRRQDEERREMKRQEAADLGSRIMDSFTETNSQGGPVEGSVSNYAGPFTAGSVEHNPEVLWPSGISQEESVGDNMHREASGRSSASASFAAWNQAPRLGDEAPVTSPPRPQPFAPIAEGFEGESRAQGESKEATVGFGGADEFFGGNPLAEESSATLQDWNVGDELGAEGGADGGSPDIAVDAASGEQPLPLEQTYGGLTWSQLQEWAEYYKQQGSSEGQVQEWVEACLANPDQYPGEFTEDPAAGQAAAATGEDQAEGERVAWQPQAAGQQGALVNKGGSGETSGDAEGCGEGVWPEGDAGPVMAEEPARNPADLMSQLREYVKAQRASDPSFGKLKSPLPWDGILTSDDDDSPLTSPRLRLGSGRKRAVVEQQPTENVVPSIPQIQEFVDTLSKTANNALGASWLDKIRQNLAEDQAAEQRQTGASSLSSKAPQPAGRSSGITSKASADVRQPQAHKVVEPQQGPSRSSSSTPKARTSLLAQESAGPQLEVHVQGPSPASQAGRVPAGYARSHSGTPRNQQLFGGEDVISLSSSPKSTIGSALAASTTIHAGSDARLQDGINASKSPFEAEEQRANGGGSDDEPSISLAQWGGKDYVALENEEEVEQTLEAAGWEGGWSVEGLENGNRGEAPGTQHTAPRQPGVVDELMEEAHKLPALQIKPPTPQAAADPTPPIGTSKALVAEVEDLRRQIMESQTEKDRLADEFTTLQDQNGKLEMELFDLKSSLDAQVAAAKDRDSGWALKESESSKSAETDARAAHLAAAKTEVTALRARLEQEQAALEEQKASLEAQWQALQAKKSAFSAGVSSGDHDSGWLAAERERLAAKEAELEEEANQLGAEREDLIQESERMLADREELEAEKESLTAEKSALARETEVLVSRKGGLGSERRELEEKLEVLSQQQDELRCKEAYALRASATAEGEAVKQLREQLSSLQSQMKQLRATCAVMAREKGSLAEESLAKNEKIQQLTGQLASVRNQLQSQGTTGAPAGMTSEEVKQLREQASLDFHRIAVLDQQNQELQERIDELEEAAGAATGPELAAAVAERDEIKNKLGAVESDAERLHSELSSLKAEFESMSARSAEAAELAEAFEKERDSVAGQIAALTASRDSLAKENAQLRKRAAKAETRAAKSAKAAEEIEELRHKLAVAEEAAASGAEAAAENDSLGSKLANANMKVAALEADVASASESHNETSAELASLRQRLSATQAESAEAAAEAEAEQNRLAAELDDAELKVQSLERARQDLEGLKERILELEQQGAAAENERSEKQSQLDALSQTLSEAQQLQTQIDSISRERDALLEKIEGMGRELADAAELANVSAAERHRLANEAASCSEAQHAADRLREELDALKSELHATKDRMSELEGRGAASAEGGGAEERAAELASRVRELEEENEEMFSRMSSMEEEADENLGKLHSAHEKLAAVERKLQEKLAATSGVGEKLQASKSEALLKTQLADLQQQLQGVQQTKTELEVRAAIQEEELSRTAARLQEVEQQVASPPTAGDASVADLQAEMAEKEQDFTDLMVCLGQETAKVEALTDRLQQQGIDALSILDQVEESYGFGDEQPDEEIEDVQGQEPKMGGSAADLSWMEDPLEDAEGDWGV